MDYNRFSLRVEAGGEGRLKLIWSAAGEDNEWTPDPYEVSRGALDQASHEVRVALRSLPMEVKSLSDADYCGMIRNLAERGAALGDNILTPAPGFSTMTSDEVRAVAAV